MSQRRELRLKKITQAILEEVQREIGRLVCRVLGEGHRASEVDLEAYWMAIRDTMHQVGGLLLEELQNGDGGGYRGVRMDCGQGHLAEFVDYREKEVLTVLSQVKVRRAYYYCEDCKT